MLWKESFRTNVDLIDAQHQELFQRVTGFLQAIKAEGHWSEKIERIKETLTFMESYVVEHFSDEEDYQKKINYPAYEEHHVLHEEFKADVFKYAQKLAESNYNEEITQEFAGKLLAWLIYHVAREDQKIGEYARQRGVQP